jgi:plastocyanin domain-containing protein
MKTALAIIIAGALIGGVFLLSSGGDSSSENNVSVSNGKQIVEITAKGKYAPKKTVAKADMPTTLRIKTNGTFDCTAALKVPAAGYEAMLPATGTTDIELPPQKAGATVQGTCAMGMYTFAINFN